jgi:hypothetical protein
MKNLELVDAGLEGSVTFEMTITSNFSNLNSEIPLESSKVPELMRGQT